MVLFLFVIMLLQPDSKELKYHYEWGPAVLLGAVFLTLAVAIVFKDPGSGKVLQGAVVQPRDLGRFLFDRYWMPIEIVSILFLVVLVVIIQLGKRKGSAGEEAERGINPVRNSSGPLNPVGIILKSKSAAEQRDIISNGVKEGRL